MVDVAARRYFTFGFDSDTAKALFPSGGAWVAFTRLIGFIEALFTAEFGSEQSWPDMIKSRHRELWRGEHDNEITQVSMVLPAALDSNPHNMMRRLQEQLPPVSRVMLAVAEARRQQQIVQGDNPQDEEKATEEEKTGVHGVQGDSDVHTGDISKSISDYANMTMAEKKGLAEKLSKDAMEQRQAIAPDMAESWLTDQVKFNTK